MSTGEKSTQSYRDLTHQLLLCSSSNQPSVEFLIEISKLLVSSFGSDALELWIREKEKCSRWGFSRNPERFYRLENFSLEQLDAVAGKGNRWFNELPGEKASLENSGGHPEWRVSPCTEGCRSLACFPLAVGTENTGLMVLLSNQPDFFSRAEVERYQDVAQTVAMAVAYQRVHLAQRERVKELTCLYELARTAAQPRLDMDTLLQKIVNCLPPAWQYPEITAGRIELDHRAYTSGGLENARHSQKSDIVVDGRRRGFVEVSYKEEKPELDEGAFLTEERSLIDTIARELALIVERKQAEADMARLQEQLRHADRLATIGQLAAGVAHELNEPLEGILGFAQLAKKHPELPEQAERDLGKIEAASLHAREVIHKLMLFARQTPPSRTQVDLNQVVEEGLYFLEARCAQSGIDLIRSLGPKLPGVIADRAQMHQILVNLVVNALQAMPEGGSLMVETRAFDEFVSLVVSDTGEGMTRKILRRIFDPFFTTKDIGDGTGLGLAVVHGIVTAHGGHIKAESKVGRGSRFEVLLPLEGPKDAKEHD